MSYIIKKTDGTTIATVPENQIVLDATSLALIGRGATNYGVSHSQNFVSLLENFANITPPPHAIDGQLWFDTTVKGLKIYRNGRWDFVGGGADQQGDSGIGGAVYVPIGNNSVIAMIAGGVIVSVIAAVDMLNSVLPATINVLGTDLPFQTRFPLGIEAGMTMATDAADYQYIGHVPIADQALFSGGGSPLAANAFIDLGANSVALTISNNVIISAYSQAVIANADLPVSFSVGGQTMPFQAQFPQGLVSGLTLASTFGIGLGGGAITGSSNLGLTLSVVDQHIAAESNARAQAITSLQAYADSTYATASSVTNITSSFTTATGQSSLSNAISYLITIASSGTAGADYGVQIRSEVTNAITGATSFGDALSKLNTSSTTSGSNATAITQISSAFNDGLGTSTLSQVGTALKTVSDRATSGSQFRTEVTSLFTGSTGQSSLANAVTYLNTQASLAGSTSTQLTTLQTQFQNVTGQPDIVSAVQKLWATANGATSIAGWGISLNANNQFAGLQLLADATNKISTFEIQADNLRVFAPGTPSIIPFEIRDNIVYIKTAVIADLSIGTQKIGNNSITTSATVLQSGINSGLGYNSYESICHYDMTLTAPANLFVVATGRHRYTNGVRDWLFSVFVNGAQIGSAGTTGHAQGFSDSIAVSAGTTLPAGTHSIDLMWAGSDNSLFLSSSTMYVQGTYK